MSYAASTIALRRRVIHAALEKVLDLESLFMISLFTGLREGELFGLTWDEGDFDQGTITLEHQVQWRSNPTR